MRKHYVNATKKAIDKAVRKALSEQRAEIRRALANYMRSEGCSCCRADDHPKHAAELGKLLKVPMYGDGSGYDFGRFQDCRSG